MDGWTGGRNGWFKGEPPHILNRFRHIHSLYISLEIRFGRTLSFSLRVDLFIVHKFINNQIPGAFYLDCDRNNHNHPPPSTYSWIKALFGLSHVGPISDIFNQWLQEESRSDLLFGNKQCPPTTKQWNSFIDLNRAVLLLKNKLFFFFLARVISLPLLPNSHSVRFGALLFVYPLPSTFLMPCYSTNNNPPMTMEFYYFRSRPVHQEGEEEYEETAPQSCGGGGGCSC